MGRMLGALGAALVAFIGATIVGELIGFWLFPSESDFTAIVDLPTGALVMIAVTWLGGAAAAAITAVRLGGHGWLALPAAAIALIVAGSSIAAEAHPLWLTAVGVIGPLLVGLGVLLVNRRA